MIVTVTNSNTIIIMGATVTQELMDMQGGSIQAQKIIEAQDQVVIQVQVHFMKIHTQVSVQVHSMKIHTQVSFQYIQLMQLRALYLITTLSIQNLNFLLVPVLNQVTVQDS